MKNRSVFLIMIFLQLGVFLAMVASKEIIVKKGSTHKFQVVSRDPYDYMRGNYLTINLDHSELEKDYGTLEDRRGYLIVKKSGEWSRISEFSQEKPEDTEYIKGRIRNSYKGKTYFENPFKRYYMEEGEAKNSEKKIIKGSKAYIIVKIYKGRYVIESIEIE